MLVTGLDGGVLSIVMGEMNACAVLESRRAKCWGSDGTSTQRLLGAATEGTSFVPVDVVVVDAGIGSMALGPRHTCAVTPSGSAACWGENGSGQLGGGSTQPVSSTGAVAVLGLPDAIVGIAVGDDHSCALTFDESVYCWGKDEQGEVGRDGGGMGAVALTPTPLVSDPDIGGAFQATTLVAAKSHTCATASGEAPWYACWGNDYQAMGMGDFQIRKTAAQVGGSDFWYGGGPFLVEIATGVHACGRAAGGGGWGIDGPVSCWGMPGDPDFELSSDALGTGYLAKRPTAEIVAGLDGGIRSIALSENGYFGCAVNDAGFAKCWGTGTSGQLGDGMARMSFLPRQVVGLGRVASVFPAEFSTCALSRDGGVLCWGSNQKWMIGDGDTQQNTWRAAPVSPVGLDGGVVWMTATSEGNRACARLADLTIRCWGGNSYGQLGIGTSTTVYQPTAIAGLDAGQSIVALSLAWSHSCARTDAGAAYCWGRNAYGQVGDNTTTSRSDPRLVFGLDSGVAAVAVGSSASYAILNSGQLRAWGNNSGGLLGTGDAGHPQKIPALVLAPAGETVVAVAPGSSFACAILDGGAAICWGSNTNGEVGWGDAGGIVPTPIGVSGLDGGVAALFVYGSTTCARLATGEVRCWGYGVGPTPTVVPGLETGVQHAAIGQGQPGYFGCALVTGGVVKCWGDDTYGTVTGSYVGYPHQVGLYP